MIYPSHWSPGDFGLEAPDTEPYKTVNRYIQKENNILDSLGKQNRFSSMDSRLYCFISWRR